jgi:hypothetical protein
MNSSASESTTARYLLAAYCVFIIYGCFIPFHFNFDPNFVRWRWLVFLTESLHEDIARPSLSDIVSNILLFVPFGILSVWARAAGSTDRAGFFPILCTTLYGLYSRPLSSPAKLLRPEGIRQSAMPCATEWVLSSVPLGVVC